MTNQEKEKAAFQSVYDSGAKDALQALGRPSTCSERPKQPALPTLIRLTVRRLKTPYGPSKNCKWRRKFARRRGMDTR